MLRSSKKLNIRGANITSKNGFIMAPIIDINGLVLRSDKDIPRAFKEFLEKKGATALVVTMKDAPNEFFVLITGNFNINKNEVIEFLSNMPELVESQSKDLSLVNHSVTFMKEISKDVLFDSGGFIVKNTKTNKTFTIPTIRTSAGGDIVMNAGEDINLIAGPETARNKISMSAGQSINLSGEIFPEIQDDQYSTPIGVMHKTSAMKVVSLRAEEKINICNTAISAGDCIDLDGGINTNVELVIDTDVEWINNPHGAFYTPMLSKSRSHTQCWHQHPERRMFEDSVTQEADNEEEITAEEKEIKNDTYCGFKPGFLLKRKYPLGDKLHEKSKPKP